MIRMVSVGVFWGMLALGARGTCAAEAWTVTAKLPAAVSPSGAVYAGVQLEMPDSPQSTTYRVQRDGEAKSVVGQLDPTTSTLWFPWRPNPSSPANSTTLQLEPADYPARVQLVDSPEGVRVVEGEQQVLFYQRRPRSREGHTRAGYFHPLRSFGGHEITDVFPADHRHHQGIFWAWHQLRVGGKPVGDPWITRDFLVHVEQVHLLSQGPVFAHLQARSHWKSPLVTDSEGAERALVEERVDLRVFHALRGQRTFDFEIRLRALLPEVEIGGAENERGYSGFTVRVRKPDEMQIRDEQGLLQGDGVSRVTRWALVTGSFGAGEVAGVSILSHPSLPEFPPRWLLRHYGMQNVVYPGRTPVPLDVKKPLLLRHRVVVHERPPTPAEVAQQQQLYESMPVPAVLKAGVAP